MPARPAFTLVEVLVATVLLLGGLATVAGSTALALRALTDARLEEESALAAARRLESLRALPCEQRLAGDAAAGALRERWWVTPHAGTAATRLVVSVAPRARPAAERRFETVAPC